MLVQKLLRLTSQLGNVVSALGHRLAVPNEALALLLQQGKYGIRQIAPRERHPLIFSLLHIRCPLRVAARHLRSCLQEHAGLLEAPRGAC